MNFADAKENYVSRHCRDKDCDVEKFDDIWWVDRDKREKFPEIKMAFYVSKRTNYVHIGLGSPLFSYSRHSQMTDTIQSFMPDELDERFPQLLSTVKWKYDYIFFQKKLKMFIF